MGGRGTLLAAGAFLAAALGLIGLAMLQAPGQAPPALAYTPMPAFTLPGLHDTEREYSEQDLKGGITLVNVWGTWCGPCRVEHPYLMELSAREGDLRLVGVNYLDDADSARAFLETEGDPFRFTLLDPGGRFGRLLNIPGAPETFLLDADGVIRYRHVGVLDERVWQDTLAPLIAQIRQ